MTSLLKVSYLTKSGFWRHSKSFLGETKNDYSFFRKASFIPGIRSRKFREQQFIEKDKIPEGYGIIYRAPMEYYLSASKAITTVTAIVIGGLTLYKYVTQGNFLNMHSTQEEYLRGLIIYDSDIIYFAVGFILITIALRVMLNKYPLRIYRNKEKYIAIFQGQMPFSHASKKFVKGEVSETYSIRLNPWSDSMYRMKDRNVILLLDYFKTPSELSDMLTK